MKTTLELIHSDPEWGHNVYKFTDRAVAFAVVVGLIAADERAYFRTGTLADQFVTSASISLVIATEAAVLTYADLTPHTITR